MTLLEKIQKLCDEENTTLAGLERDIDFENKTISIIKSVEFQNNKPHTTETKTPTGVRKIPLLGLLADALQPIRNLSPDTYILSGSITQLTWTQYDKKWTEFWKKHGFARKVEKTENQKKNNGKYYECHVIRWRADVVAHQFRHEYVCMLCMAGVSEEISIQLVGHANANMIHEVYMALKPQMIKGAGEKLDAFLQQS
jgi:integrase